MLNKIKGFRWGYVLLFLMLAAIGACFIVFYETLPTLALIIGIILIIYGIFAGVIAISDKKRGAKYAFKVTIALICVICGVITAILRESAVNILASLIGLFLIMDGSFKLHTAAMSKRYKLLSWWLMVIPAVLVIAGGFTSLKLDHTQLKDGQAILSLIIGVSIIIDAIANFLSAFYVGGFEKKLVREIRQEIDLENEKKQLAAAEAAAEGETAADAPCKTDSEAAASADTSDAESVPTESDTEPAAYDSSASTVAKDETAGDTNTEEQTVSEPDGAAVKKDGKADKKARKERKRKGGK